MHRPEFNQRLPSLRSLAVVTALITGCNVSALHAGESGVRFGAQLRLDHEGTPVDGPVDLRIALYASASGGQALDSIALSGVRFDDGLATLPLAFGALTPPPQLWIETQVAQPGSGSFASLQPRLRVHANPLALTAASSAPMSIDAAAIRDNEVQRRIGACPSGAPRMRGVASSGGATCTEDRIGVTQVVAGTGLLASGTTTTTLAADPQQAQRRADITCPAGSAIGAIGADGVSDCRIDSSSSGAGLVNSSASCTFSGAFGTASSCTAQALCPPTHRVPLAVGYISNCPGASPMSLEPIETPGGIGWSSLMFKPADSGCGIGVATHTVHVVCSPSG